MPSPKILQINVSKAKEVLWNGQTVFTGIFKTPVTGSVKVRRLNLDGDEQADLTVHGGSDKAVYVYPTEQYEHWKQEYPSRDLEWGIFGENLTVSGFDETNTCIGDKLQIGDAIFQVTQPRMPCYKQGIRFGDPGIIKLFYKSCKWGFYLSVLQEGTIEAGNEIIRLEKSDSESVRLVDVSKCLVDKEPDPDLVARVLNSQLAEQMKYQLQSRFSA
ncbi:MOSC domain-containing protein [soil metagenome]